MGIFGASLLPSAAFADGKRREPAPEFKPRQRTLADNLGLLADAFHGNDRHRRLLMEQDEQDRAQWLAQLQRAQDFADFTRKYDYQIAHPKPQQPTALQRDYEYLNGMNPQLGRQFIQNKVNPIQGVPITNPDGSQGLRFIRPSDMGAPSGPQPGAIEDGYRFKGGNPADQNNWEPVGANADQAASILSGASASNTITPAQAAIIRDSLGPNGDAAFQQWLMTNNIRIGQ